MSLSQFLSILRARWWIVLLVLLVTVGTTLLVSMRLPKQYIATASIVVDVKPDPIAGIAAFNTLTTSSYMATQVDIISSERVAKRVVQNLKLADNPQVRQQWRDATEGQGDFESWLGDSLQRNLDVRPSRDSNVISVNYKSPDPRFAAALANAFVKGYIDTTLDLRVDPAKQYTAFFDARVKDARERLELAQSRLSDFQKDKGIIANDERFDIENARLNELSSQLVVLQALSSESGSRQAQAIGASGDRMQEVLNSPLIGGLKADLSRAEARLQEVTSRLGDNHPQVAEARANVASVREKIDQETRRVTSGIGVTARINRQRESELRASLEAQRAKVLRMKAVRDDGAVLQRDVESAQRAYEAVQARLTQTSLESQNTQSNVFQLAEASAPLEPASPRVGLNTLLSLVVGSALALAAMMAVEFVDRRVRTLDDIGDTLGLPVLGTLPKPGARRQLGFNKRGWSQQRVLASLPGPNKG